VTLHPPLKQWATLGTKPPEGGSTEILVPQNSYSNIYFHITWHTKDNKPLLTPELSKEIYFIIRRKCNATREVLLVEIGGIENHVHLAVKVPPTLLMSKWIGELKGASSFEVNQAAPQEPFAWQEGYGIVSFKGKDVDIVREYIRNQPQRHKTSKINLELEKVS
jgi:putative transposase